MRRVDLKFVSWWDILIYFDVLSQVQRLLFNTNHRFLLFSYTNVLGRSKVAVLLNLRLVWLFVSNDAFIGEI